MPNPSNILEQLLMAATFAEAGEVDTALHLLEGLESREARSHLENPLPAHPMLSPSSVVHPT